MMPGGTVLLVENYRHGTNMLRLSIQIVGYPQEETDRFG
jgi:hypothetical protein